MPRERLERSVPFSVLVSTIDSETVEDNVRKLRECSGWILDICLDYFGTFNPFARTLEVDFNGCHLSSALRSAAIGIVATESSSIELRLQASRALEKALVRVLLDPACVDSSIFSEGDSLLELCKDRVQGVVLLRELANAVHRSTTEQVFFVLLKTQYSAFK